jgi:hypothetical protein
METIDRGQDGSLIGTKGFPTSHRYETLTWPNKTPGKWPSWMRRSTLHALRLLATHPELNEEDHRHVRNVIDMVEETQGE